MVSANYVGDLVIPNVQAAIRYALYRQECSGLGNFVGGRLYVLIDIPSAFDFRRELMRIYSAKLFQVCLG